MSGLSEVIKAADFAARKHMDQRRKAPDQQPYINHPIGVANILANEGNIEYFFYKILKKNFLSITYYYNIKIGGITDPIVLQAALLHDTVEDTDTTLDEIEENFGKVVRE